MANNNNLTPEQWAQLFSAHANFMNLVNGLQSGSAPQSNNGAPQSGAPAPPTANPRSDHVGVTYNPAQRQGATFNASGKPPVGNPVGYNPAQRGAFRPPQTYANTASNNNPPAHRSLQSGQSQGRHTRGNTTNRRDGRGAGRGGSNQTPLQRHPLRQIKSVFDGKPEYIRPANLSSEGLALWAEMEKIFYFTAICARCLAMGLQCNHVGPCEHCSVAKALCEWQICYDAHCQRKNCNYLHNLDGQSRDNLEGTDAFLERADQTRQHIIVYADSARRPFPNPMEGLPFEDSINKHGVKNGFKGSLPREFQLKWQLKMYARTLESEVKRGTADSQSELTRVNTMLESRHGQHPPIDDDKFKSNRERLWPPGGQDTTMSGGEGSGGAGGHTVSNPPSSNPEEPASHPSPPEPAFMTPNPVLDWGAEDDEGEDGVSLPLAALTTNSPQG